MLLTIFAAVAGMLATLTIVVFLAASCANASPRAVRNAKWMMLASFCFGMAMVLRGFILGTHGHPGWGALLSAGPAIFVFVAMVWLELS